MNSERLEMLGSLTATISIDVWRLTAPIRSNYPPITL